MTEKNKGYYEEKEKVISMEQFEKVEKLRERANVSYEEAREALEQANWDLLDAMVYLEKMGKVQGPKESSYSTSYEEQTQYASVRDTVHEQQHHSSEGFGKKLGRMLKKFWKWSNENEFRVSRYGQDIIKVPFWVFLIFFLFLGWNLALPVMIVALFFGVHYSIEGKSDMRTVNDVMDKASRFAEKVKEDYRNL